MYTWSLRERREMYETAEVNFVTPTNALKFQRAWQNRISESLVAVVGRAMQGSLMSLV